MITWRNVPIDKLTASELRVALNDAVDELMRVRSGDPSQLTIALVAGFVAGALGCAAGMAILNRMLS